MPVRVDFTLGKQEDGAVILDMTSPIPLGGEVLHFKMSVNYDGSPLVEKWCNSGFNGVSGITILDSGAGRLQIRLNPFEVSGLDQGIYAFKVVRETSGRQSVLTQGYRLME